MKTIHIAALALSIAALSICSAWADNWYWGYTVDVGTQYTTSGAFGADSESSDGFDSYDWLIEKGPRPYCGTYHEAGVDAWTGQTGFYRTEMRSFASLQVGETRTWRFYVWADPTSWWASTSINLTTGPLVRVPDQILMKLVLVNKPTSITDGPEKGTVWNLSQNPQQKIALPIYRTSNGLDGYVFDLTATVVPEPSSLAAMAGALASLGVFTLRRKHWPRAQMR